MMLVKNIVNRRRDNDVSKEYVVVVVIMMLVKNKVSRRRDYDVSKE